MDSSHNWSSKCFDRNYYTFNISTHHDLISVLGRDDLDPLLGLSVEEHIGVVLVRSISWDMLNHSFKFQPLGQTSSARPSR